MENNHTISPSATDFTRHPLPTDRLTQRLIVERLRALAEQACAEMTMAFLILAGSLALSFYALETQLLSFGAPVVAIYLVRTWLAYKFLRCTDENKNLHWWLRLFVFMSALCGVAWGIFISVLMLFGDSNSLPYISLLIGGLTVAAILSLGALMYAYIGYTLGILLPIAITLLIDGNGFEPGLTWVILAYAAFLMFTMANFHHRINAWLRLTSENAELANHLYDLYDERRHIDRAWGDLEDRLQHLLRKIQ